MTVSARNAPATAATIDDPRWQLLASRDPAADGKFYYAVKTTGIYCRPSCAARRARPENVEFYGSREAAERAGFRPCKRCQPRLPSSAERYAETVKKICRLIEISESAPSLRELARQAALSPYHFHRLFKSLTGVTPKGYAAAHRAARLKDLLRASPTVTTAIYDGGFQSTGRFYEAADGVLGMTPTQYRAGGTGSEIRFAIGECSLGTILVAATERGVCAISLGDDPELLVRQLQERFPGATLVGDDRRFERLVGLVVGFVDGLSLGVELPLDIRGTAFQRRVWQALRKIPLGSTATYTEIARRIGSPTAVRAVARACAANTLAVAIPCHRVVRMDGGLSGYRWGIERKRALLDKEAKVRCPGDCEGDSD